MKKIEFTQLYGEPGANFPFSHHFQRRLSEEIAALVVPSPKFLKKYGSDFGLTFYVSAKKSIQDYQIRGPGVYRKTKDVEYSVFLPFDAIMSNLEAPKSALVFLLKGVCEVFDMLEIDKTKVLEKQDSIIDGICSDPTMLADPSWNEADNQTQVRFVFEAFFKKNQNREAQLRSDNGKGKTKGYGVA